MSTDTIKRCKKHHSYKDQWVLQGKVEEVYQYALYKICLNCDYVHDTGQRRQTKELPQNIS